MSIAVDDWYNLAGTDAHQNIYSCKAELDVIIFIDICSYMAQSGALTTQRSYQLMNFNCGDKTILILALNFFAETWKYIVIFHHLPTLKWHSLLKSCWTYSVNTFTADDLAIQVAMPSADMVLT